MSSTNSSLPSFILMGIFGTNDEHVWLSIPLCVSYSFSLIGNSLIIFIVKADMQLQEPMYFLLSMLAATDLGMTLITLPTVLGVLWFEFRTMNFNVCLTQMYFIHSLTATGSAILVAMAFDRYVAICNPLRYASILHPMISKIGLVVLGRGVIIMLPQPFLLTRLDYCGNKKLHHAFCFFPDLMKLACTDITINNIYGLFTVILTFCLDSVTILFSYLMILKTLLTSASKEKSLKAFSTCASHISVVLIFYIPLIGLTMAHRYAKNASPLLPLAMGFVYLCIPQTLNPIIYSMKTKQIRNALRKQLF
ncbi:olfactory receptor 51G2-like [Pleurodeles waltl]|uniref:olfactory receptor 51G2-like n=1 Tax=Pleurodeles waltl TaxID=8319 RepID=UPI0037097463